MFWAVVVSVCAMLVAGCGGDAQDVTDELTTARTLVEVLGLADSTGPEVVESKDVSYVTATGQIRGSQGAVAREVRQRLLRHGWTVGAVMAIDVSGSPATQGKRLIAANRCVVTQLSVFDRLGTTRAAEDHQFVQVSVAKPTGRLQWTQSTEAAMPAAEDACT